MKNGFLTVFYTEWRKFFASPKRMFWVLGVPILIFLFFGSLFKTGVPHNLPIAIVDYDQTPMSRKLLRDINANSTIDISQIVQTEKQAKTLIQRGDVYAFIIIPEDFEKHIYRGVQDKVVCYINNQFILPAGLIQRSFLQTMGQFSTQINLDKRLQKGESIYSALADVQSIRIDAHVLYNPFTNYNYYLSLAFVPMMFQLLVMIMSVYVLGLVLKRKKGKKLYKMAGKSVVNAVLGKLLPYTLLFMVMAWTMNIFLFDYIGIPSNAKTEEMFLISLLLILVYQSVAVFFVAMSPNFRSALTFGGGFSALAFSFSGYTFPMDGLPMVMQWGANVFPFTHFLHCFVNISIRNFHISESMPSLCALCTFFIFGVLALPRLKKILKKGGYEKAI